MTCVGTWGCRGSNLLCFVVWTIWLLFAFETSLLGLLVFYLYLYIYSGVSSTHLIPPPFPSSIVGLTDLVVKKRQKRIGVVKDPLFLNS